MLTRQGQNFLSSPFSTWQRLGIGLFLGLALVFAEIFAGELQDRWKEPYLQSPQYSFAGDCRAHLINSRWIPLSCAQPQYEVRYGYYIYEYGLSQLNKATNWYRIGDDAAMLGCTAACRMDDIRKRVFGHSVRRPGVMVGLV